MDPLVQQIFLIKEAVIKRQGEKWKLFSRKGKLLGTHSSKAAALKQERAIEISKHAAFGNPLNLTTPRSMSIIQQALANTKRVAPAAVPQLRATMGGGIPTKVAPQSGTDVALHNMLQGFRAKLGAALNSLATASKPGPSMPALSPLGGASMPSSPKPGALLGGPNPGGSMAL